MARVGEDFFRRSLFNNAAKVHDRDTICERVYDNLAIPATGPFHPLGTQADPDIEPWPYDPDRAAALLAEAGFKRNDDGVLEDAEGRPFTFNFIIFLLTLEAIPIRPHYFPIQTQHG